MALRGHASIQGSTDIPTLYNILPGYLAMPMVGDHDTWDDYLTAIGNKDAEGLLGQRRRVCREPAQGVVGGRRDRRRTTGPTTTCRDSTGAHGTYQTTMAMKDGEVEGYFLLGRTPPSARRTPGCSAWPWPS